MSTNFFRSKGGFQIGLSGVSFLQASGIPYTSGDFASADVTSMSVGTLWIDTDNGDVWSKTSDASGDITDWEKLSTGSSSLIGFIEGADFVADQQGDNASYTSWAGTSPGSTETFLDTSSGIIYVGNGTGTPDTWKDAAATDSKRIAIKNDSDIYLGTGSSAIIENRAGHESSLSTGDAIVIKEDENQTTSAIYGWDGSNLYYIADAEWAYSYGITVGTGYSEDTSETAITDSDNVQEALEKLEGKLSNIKTNLSTVNITDATLTTIETIDLFSTSGDSLSYEYLITVNDSTGIYQARARVVGYYDGTDSIVDYTVDGLLDSGIDITPVISFSGSTSNTTCTLSIQASDWSSGSYAVNVEKRVIFEYRQ